MNNDHVSVRTWVAVVGAALGAFLAILNIQIVSSSLSDIQGAIGAGSDEGGWITTAYLVAEIIVIPMSGWLARVFSTRTYLLTNTVLFLILTVACAFTKNLGQMIVVRAMQGFAGGVLIPLAFSIIMTRLPPSKHAIGLSIYSVSAIFAPSIGPVIGGYFNQTFGWQAIFYVNLLPGSIMLGLLWFALDAEPRQLHLLRKGDWWGILSIAIGLGCLETVLEEGEKDDWFGSPFIVRLSVIAAVALSVFVCVQLRRQQPLLQLRLLARRNFGLGTLANFFFGLSMYTWVYILPLYLARIHGYNSEQVGYVLIWIGIPQLLMLPLVPALMRRFDPRKLVAVGYLILIGGSLLATNLSMSFAGPQFIASSLIRALGQVLVMTPLSAIAVAGIEREHAGSAAALFNMTRNLGGAIGIAVLQTFMSNSGKYHSDVITPQVSLLNDATRQRLDPLTQWFLSRGVSDPEFARHQAIVDVGRLIRREASILAFSDTIILQSALLGLAFLAVLLLKKTRTGNTGEAH
ncbi:multidrug efflux MFS transporter [Pseudomonas tolaasii]|uniref:Multidrug efflux MFS transporter n=4 Tax=Pseudomonadota TaxID=1224 RepID=A0A7Y8ANP3_PSETO|nr:MDR family MFS transporter [Pseudomonas tolaasii]ARB31082.1 EmrB/QacA family drug resistance transporter [Pseudomonas tolaasii]KAB0474406.1 multidrug efflux MFS transporter [Pseudomonas tolaasii]MBW1248468.1 multidrug efflux MFS transporter [Pseudomonas tolaasii]MBY8940178.1 multidrug efflux MFS transporter [Pseudomonas tolaasii]NWC19922.1 multidrug efflux MFS transporter [Pseudomonas tolaasii]